MLAVLDEEFTTRLDADYDADLERSVDIDLGLWRRRAWLQRVREASVPPDLGERD